MKRVAICLGLLLGLALTGCFGTSNKPLIEKESGIRGIPPLYWYRGGEDGYVVVPALLSYLQHDKERTLTFGLLGLVHFGSEKREYDENGLLSEKFAIDLNFLGIWTSWGMEKASGGKINKQGEGLLLGGLFGIGSINGKTYFKLLGMKLGAKDAPPIERKIKCRECEQEVLGYYDLECSNCGQLYKE
ncbi:MAG: hypothetical protein E3J72_01615 [Planctomycetota bacterium]|nr:MAG: hypothetical protein E3J72_01615 [Planctomycetota bacterium]